MLSGLVASLLMLIALLAIPVTLRFQVSWPQALQSYIKLQWGFGLVNIQLPSFKSKTYSLERKISPDTTKPNEHTILKKKKFFALIRQKIFRRRVIRFIRDIWQAVKKREIKLLIRIGLGDPADTGQLWSLVGPVSGMLANIKEASLKIEPDFFASTFEVDGRGIIRLIPLQIIYLTVVLFLSPAVWQGIRHMRRVE